MPMLPIEEEGRLNDARLRESFVVRVFSSFRWQQQMKDGFSRAALVDFHSRHKYLLMAHSVEDLRELGRLVANVKDLAPSVARTRYADGFARALQRKATPRKHANVMHHLLGYLKKILDHRDRQELLQSIEDYRNGLVPLIVPMTLIRHHMERNEVDYIRDQAYLYPHPKELMLLNHV
jgi:uncharacterized protein YbgA (DUF1722 family)